MAPSLNKFYKLITSAKEERDVEVAYAQAFQKAFKGVDIAHYFKCDGYIENIFMRLIIEYKYNEDFTKPTEISKVLVQVLYYMKQFELEGRALPNVIFVGDKNECFILHSNALLDYLDEPVDWTIAPSNAAAANMDLVMKISRDSSINPFILDINEEFQFSAVIERIEDLANNETSYVRVTEHNLSNSFESFVQKVIKRPKDYSPTELVAIYMGTITDKENYFKHPNNPNKLIANGRTVEINGVNYDAFFSYFDRTYTPKERSRFTEIADRLVEDTKRRREGEFYTPTPFVDYSHRMISEALGENWKEEYVVWDNCWGTGNLTRDYRFKELYISNKDEQEMAIGVRYNRDASKFAFDFLNDDIEPDIYGHTKVPEGLRQAIQDNRPLVFFLNPPYANNTGEGKLAGTSDQVCYTKVRDVMNNVGLDACVANLYAQFMYRILMIKEAYKLTNVKIGIFCPTLFLTGISWKGFRQQFLKQFKFIDGVFFQASYFSNVSASWGIGFTVWECGETVNKESFDLGLLDMVDGELSIVGRHTLYNIDTSLTASEWVRQEVKGLRTYDSINLTSAIKVREKDGTRKGMITEGALGYFYNAGNNVDKNVSHVAMYTAASSLGIGVSVIPENLVKCCTLFAARKLVNKNWINSKDEYLAPNMQHPKWEEFAGDSIVYTLFHGSGNQSSLRNVIYHNKRWDVKNSFFFMSKETVLGLAEQCNYDFTYEDARTDSERFVYELLKKQELSEEAKAVLEFAIALTIETFPDRVFFDQEQPDYQIMNWDCGWYQIKALVGWRYPQRLEEFNVKFQKLCEKMLPMVYELGFLRQ